MNQDDWVPINETQDDAGLKLERQHVGRRRREPSTIWVRSPKAAFPTQLFCSLRRTDVQRTPLKK